MGSAKGKRKRPGEIRDAIMVALREAGGDATIAEIHGAVAKMMDEEIAPSSIRSYLRLNTPVLFTRMGRGRYRLRSTK